LLPTARRLRLLLLSALASVSLAMGFVPPAQDAAAPPAQAAALKQIVASGRLADMRWPDFSDYKVLVDGFYAPAGYAPAWVQGGKPSASALALIQAFRDAGKRGLEPEDYDASRWDARIQALKGPNADVARFDAALTICAMRLVSDLHIGRINPQHFHFGLSVQGRSTTCRAAPRAGDGGRGRLRGAGRRRASVRRLSTDGRRSALPELARALPWSRYPSRRRPSNR
jgi:hypothetical protein